jgi:hypothetical protein
MIQWKKTHASDALIKFFKKPDKRAREEKHVEADEKKAEPAAEEPEMELHRIKCVRRRRNNSIPGEGHLLTHFKSGGKDVLVFHDEEWFRARQAKTWVEVVNSAVGHPGSWVNFDGALPQDFVIPVLPRPVGFVWPLPTKKFRDCFCALAACFNAGIDVTEKEFSPFMSLRAMVTEVGRRKGSRWKFHRRAAPGDHGVFVLSAHNHCFTVIDGWYLDSDERFPYPVRDENVALLRIFRIDDCYEVVKR